jgi:integrase
MQDSRPAAGFCRPSLASLRIEQIKLDGAVWYFDVQEGKNLNSIRRIPIHKKILDSGFWKYYEKIKFSKDVQLFPHLKPGANGYSKNCSRRFGEFLDLAGITDKRKVFHSFRATFINSMTNIGTHPAVLMGIVGHYEQSKLDFSSPHFQTYQQIKPLEVLNAAIQKLDYDNILIDL